MEDIRAVPIRNVAIVSNAGSGKTKVLVDRIARLLSPLPPENAAELIGVAVGLGSKTGAAKVGKVSICEA